MCAQLRLRPALVSTFRPERIKKTGSSMKSNHWAQSEDSGQTEEYRLNWVWAELIRHFIVFVKL